MGMLPEIIKIEVAKMRREWTSMPPVTVVNSVKDLPFESPVNADGAYSAGRVYLVAENILDLKQFQKVMAHECVMHHSLEDMLGHYGFAKLNQGVHKLKASGDPTVCALAENIAQRYGSLSEKDETREIVARAGELCLDEKGDVKVEFGWMKSVFASFASWLRKHGIQLPFSNIELQGIIHDAGKWIVRETFKGEKALNCDHVATGVLSSLKNSFGVASIVETTIIRNQKFISVDGIDRPAQNSLGRPIHWNEEGIRNFWREFDGTKTLDSQGRPSVMVHATFSSNITSFNKSAMWFSSVDDTSAADIIVAEGNLLPNSDPDNFPDVGAGATFYPVYLCLKNPAPEHLAAAFYDGDITAKSLQEMGYDGLEWDDGVCVVFNSSQVKSAIGNDGMFKRDDKRILHSLSGDKLFDSPLANNLDKSKAGISR